jgi:hypothetical protein
MEQKRSARIHARFQKARQKRQLKDDNWYELDAFDRGDQWSISGKSLPPWLPKPVTNYIHLVKYMKRASLAIENPTGKLRATSPLDIEPIKQLQNVYEFVFQKVKARKTIREIIETGKLLGTGIAQVFWDENAEGLGGYTVQGGTGGQYEGEIKVRQLDPSSVYPDPNAFTIEDCQYIHIVERKPISWLKKHPTFGKNMGDVESRSASDSERGEIYHRDYNVASSDGEKDGLIDFHSHYEKKQNSEGGFDYSVTYLAGEKEVGHIEKLEPNCYPFAIYYDFPQRQDFWGLSTCSFILDNQKIINKVEAIIAMIGALLQNPQKIVYKPSGINPQEMTKYGSEPSRTWVSNVPVSQAVSWMPLPNIPMPLINLLEQAKANIREVTGLTEAYMGQTVGSLQTSSGVSALIERSTMRDRDQMYDVELFVEQLSRLIVKFITTKYTEPRYGQILRGKQTFEQNPNDFFQFVGRDYADLEFDFHIDVSAKAPITRMRLKEEARELLEIRAQYNPKPEAVKDFVEASDFVNQDQMIERLDQEILNVRAEQAMQVVEQLHQMMLDNVPKEQAYQQAMQMFAQLEQEQGGN